MAAPNNLVRWLKKRLNVIEEHKGPIERYEVWHCEAGSPGTKLETFRITSDTQTTSQELADDIWEIAYDDAKGRDSELVERFQVFAYFAKETEHDTAITFNIRGAGSSRKSGDLTEGPTKEGLVSQSMRHAERLHHSQLDKIEAIMGSAARMVSDTAEENRVLREGYVANLQATQEMLDLSQERKLEFERTKRREDRLDQLFEAILPMVPALASQLKIFKDAEFPTMGTHPLEMGMRKFFKSMSEPQLEQFFAMLGTEQQGAMAMLYKQLKARDESDARKSLPEKKGDTKDDPETRH